MQANRESGNFTTDGLPIAVPGTGTLGIPTVFSGAVREQRSKDALFRPDERLIVTEFNNLTIDTGTNFQVIDISEAGELHSIVIVSDNPYLQVFLQIDDFRNAEPHGLTVAELLFNGDVTQTSQRRFKAVDGQSPTVGYAMVFEPMKPVQYTDRLRIIVYNNIPANPNVYGKDLGFRNSATLPTPAAPAHMAGATFEQSSLASVPLREMAQAMSTPVGSPAYFSGKVYNVAALNGQLLSGMKLGTDHPYVGIAGKPSFQSDPSCTTIPKERIGTSTDGFRDAPYRLKVRDDAERFPGTPESPSSMVLDIVCQVGESGVLNGTNGSTGTGGGKLTDAPYESSLGFGLTITGAHSLAVASAGAGYSPTSTTISNLATTYAGNGSGLTVDVTVNGAGAITGAVVNNGGSGYTNGDVVTVVGGNATTAATLTVTVNTDHATFDNKHANYPVGKRMYYRVGGQIAMLGECAAVSLTFDNESTNELVGAGGSSVIGKTTQSTPLSSASGNDYKAPEFHLKIEPGLAGASNDFASEVLSSNPSLTDGLTTTTEFARWGIVTSQADTNPKIFVKKIDVRRRKVYSKEG